MDSIGDLSGRLSGIFSGIGLKIPEKASAKKKIVCFNNKEGRICEELPEEENIQCNKEGICSVFLNNIEYSNKIEGLADKLGMRTFATVKDGISTKSLTGIVEKKDLEKLSKILRKDLIPTEVEKLRAVSLGRISPPSICKLNPLSSVCEPYTTSRNWHYMGPLAGWIDADNFREAVKIVSKKKTTIKEKNQIVKSIQKNTSSKNRILTTI